jgi:hypothetical protein
VLAGLAAALAAAGCGGSGDESAATETAAAPAAATSQPTTADGHTEEEDADAGHSDGTVDATEDMAVALTVEEDSKKGYNVHIATEGFTFTPEAAGGDHVPGEGHAHVYVDGEQVARLYSDWYWLGPLDPGEHQVRVTLNASKGDTVQLTVVSDSPVEAHVHGYELE